MAKASWFRMLLVLLLLAGQYTGYAHAITHLADPAPTRDGAPVEGAKVCDLCLLSGHLSDALVASTQFLRAPAPPLPRFITELLGHTPRLLRAFYSRAPPAVS